MPPRVTGNLLNMASTRLLWVSILLSSLPPGGCQQYSSRCGYNLGDVNIIVMTDIYNVNQEGGCSSEKHPGWWLYTQGVESFAYKLSQINKSTQSNQTDLLPNVTMGFVVMDACHGHFATVTKFTNLITGPEMSAEYRDKSITDDIPCEQLSLREQRLVGVYGLSQTDQAKHVTSLAGVFNVPVLAFSAQGQELSDKSNFKFLSRMKSSTAMQIEATLDFFEHQNWTYISFIYQEDSWGEGAAKLVLRSTELRGMCIAVREPLPFYPTDKQIQVVAERLAAKPNARVVLMFVWGLIVKMVTGAVKTYPAFNPIWFGTGFNPEQIEAFDWNGGFVTEDTYLPDLRFRQYMKTLHPSPHGRGNRWLPEVFEDAFGCLWHPEPNTNATPCAEYEKSTLPDDYMIDFASVDSEAADTYAHALHALMKDKCPEVFSGQNNSLDIYECVKENSLLDYLRTVHFEGINGPVVFDANGDRLSQLVISQYTHRNGITSYKEVGGYDGLTSMLRVDEEKIDWAIFSEIYPGFNEPYSVCSQPCKDKEYSVPLEERCCWECRTCRPNEKLNGNKTDCITCPILTWPDDEFAATCEFIEPVYTNLLDILGLAMMSITILGIILGMLTILWFVKNKNEKLIKASSRELSAFILVGIILAFIIAVLFLLKPSDVICQLRISGFHISVSLIFAPLFMKSNRIYRIFAAGKKGTKSPAFIGNKIQVLFTSGLLCFQIVITAFVWVTIASEPVHRMPVAIDRFVELNCSLPMGALLPGLIFNLMLLSMCAMYGYLTRKLPENFNESWYIFVSVATTLFLWLVFIPAYFTAFYASHQVVLLCCCLFFNAYITLICLFWPKIYAVKVKNESELKVNIVTTTTSVGSAAAAKEEVKA